MTNEEKTKELADFLYFKLSYIDYGTLTEKFLEMAKWKEQQLDEAIDKALEHHSNKLKEGKITQYGMDNVFAFVQNIRTLLNNGINIKETN